MIMIGLERPIIGKQLPIVDKGQKLIEIRTKIDPFSLPPIRDVYEPLIRRETVRFNPFDGEIFILGQRDKQGQVTIDKFNPKKEIFWINFSCLDEATSTLKEFYHNHGKHKIVENTEEIISSVIDVFPQFFEGDLNEQLVKSIVSVICSTLVLKGKIKEADNQEYIKHALHNHRGIRNGHYSEQENKSRLGSVVLDIINDLIAERGITKYYSPTLANLLVEQQIEKQFITSLQEDFTKSIEQLLPHGIDLKILKNEFLELLKKYFNYPIFRCAPIKQSAEEIRKTILKINKLIDEFGDWNPKIVIEDVESLTK